MNGFYGIHFGMRFSEREIPDSGGKTELDLGAKPTALSDFAQSGQKQVWVLLLAAVLALSALEWFSYHRRVTV